jgi:phosphoribosylformimino-5-aminoimidazole carboxamide ribotide isomerase
MTIYPAIDLKGGQCVRLKQGDMDSATVYGDDPAAAARGFAKRGAEWLHVVDLDGAFAGESRNLGAIHSIVDAVGIPVQLGGGIRSMAQLNLLFKDVGISRAIIGTAALEDDAFLRDAVERFDGRIAVGIDARDGRVAVRGWADATRTPARDLALRVKAAGVKTIIYTDISRDGMLSGPNFPATEELIRLTGLEIIISGGVASIDDIERAVNIHASGIVIGKALYAGAIQLEEAIAAGGKPC